MAVNDTMKSTSATARRWLFGTNLILFVVLVLFIVVGINLLAQVYSVRADLASGADRSHQLSQRSKWILDQFDDQIRVTTVYVSDEPETDREEYLPKLRDYCTELAHYSSKVKVEHLGSGAEAAALRNRIRDKHSEAAGDYLEVIKAARNTWDQLAQDVEPVEQQLKAVQARPESWLGSFFSLAQHTSKIRKDMENIEEARLDVQELVEGEGIPRYTEANTKINEANTTLKEDLQAVQDWLAEVNKLADALSSTEQGFAAETQRQLTIGRGLLLNAMKSVGGLDSDTVPDDPTPMLTEFSSALGKLADWFIDETARVNRFVEEHPALQDHRDWLIDRAQGGLVFRVPLVLIMAETAEYSSSQAEIYRQILRQEDVATDKLQRRIREGRELIRLVQGSFQEWRTGILMVTDTANQIDPESMNLMVAGAEDRLFQESIDQLDNLETQIEELPALELDDIAEGLTGENLVVIEAGGEVRVVEFDNVWPIADPTSRMGQNTDQQETARVFDADSAISGAMLGMLSEEPFATVIFVAYEKQPPPQMRQMGQQTLTGPVPLSQLSTLTDRLELANFKVETWNLGAEGEEAQPPELGENAKPIYVFLIPAPTPPRNPMSQQPPPEGFGQAELAQVRSVLQTGAPAIFLANWQMPRMVSPFMPPQAPEYAYGDLLQEEYGIEVDSEYRLLGFAPDKRHVDKYTVDVMQFAYLQMSNFTEHPVGQPLRNRRVLMTDVCPVVPVGQRQGEAEVPEDVTLSPILKVSAENRDVWAENAQGLQRINDALINPDRGGLFEKDPVHSWDPPFSVIMAARKQQAGEGEAEDEATTQPTDGATDAATQRVMVMGNGRSYTDRYLQNRVARLSAEGDRTRFMTDPPPVENLDLFVNAVYWLNDQPEMIAAGPADVPLVPVLEPGTRTQVLIMAVVWSALVMVVGGVVWFMRRQ